MNYDIELEEQSPRQAHAAAVLGFGIGELMSRVDQLRASLAPCRERRVYCERQLLDFAKSADLSNPRQQRALQKLKSDLSRVEDDVSWLQKQLDDMMD